MMMLLLNTLLSLGLVEVEQQVVQDLGVMVVAVERGDIELPLIFPYQLPHILLP
tara:strand:+ start:201 stop:362 length:162 start_codon:yes stop_codon:yes gene_type:complete